MGVSVYYNDYLLYSTTLESLKLVLPKVTQEVNKVGSFTFKIYPDHPYYNMVERFKGLVTVYDEGVSEPLFRGRIIKDEVDFYNERNITCEGELAFLLDSVLRPYEFSGTPAELFEQYITSHNAQVDSSRQFTVGKITVTDPNDYIVRSNSNYVKTWDEISDKLLNLLGGYLWTRHVGGVNYIDYLADFTTMSNQEIAFGKNLLGLTKTMSAESFATALVPLGAQDQETGERLTIKSVNGGADYVYNAAAAAKYGYIYTTNIWNDVTNPSNLKRKAQEYIDGLAQFAASVSVSAADLNGTGADVNSFRIGRYIKVESGPHGIEQNFIVSKLVRQIDKPEATKLTLGASYKTLTEKQSGTAQSIGNLVTRIDSTEKKLLQLEDGKVIVSESEPADKNLLWLDTSAEPSVLKRYDGEKWEAVNDQTAALILLEQRVNSSISQTSSDIMSEVSEQYYAKWDTEALVSSVSTQVEQTAAAVEIRFEQFYQNLSDLADGTDAQFTEIAKYIRFVDGNIILGEAGNQITLRIENDRISFLDNNTEVAYFSNNKLYVTDGEFLNKLQLGNFAFIPRSNGNLSFTKV